MSDNISTPNLAHANEVQNHFIDTFVHLGFVDRAKLKGYESRNEAEIVKYLSNGICSSEQIAKAYSSYFGLPYVLLKDKKIDPAILKMIPLEEAKNLEIISYGLNNKNLELGVGDPTILQSQPPAILNKFSADGYAISLSIISIDDLNLALSMYNTNPVTSEQVKPNVPMGNPPAASEQVKSSASGGSPQISDLPRIDLLGVDIPKEVLLKFPKEVAQKYKMVVFETDPPINISKMSKMIKVALLNPDDVQAKDILEFIRKKNNLEIIKFKCDQDGLDKSLEGYPEAQKAHDLKETEKKIVPSESISSAESQMGNPNESGDQTKIQDEPKSLNEPIKQEITSKEITNDQINPISSTSDEKKMDQMQAIASGVLKPEEVRIKEGVSHPYSQGADGVKDAIPEMVLEVKAEDIDKKAGLQSHSDMDDNNLEESNLDKFLTKPVNSVEDLESVIKGGMVPEIVAAIVSLGIVLQISDVHIEAATENVRLRFRIDGILKDIIRMPLSLHAPLVSRIKILSKLKIDEQRVPQDGRFDVIVRSHEIDLRVSTLPTVHGEKVVMRILDKSVGILTLEDMGITGVGFDILVKNIKKPYGIILATGPTGSGKSTTLYAILQRISTTAVNVITLEDPVEYEIPGINQTQVKPQIGFTFAEGLRSVLRQDPNIIMVGEIRDLETAAMATHAALTGHLVLSTLHTNDSAGALPRLINMGVEPFLITSSVNCIVAQRLVRKICPKCKDKVALPDALIDELLKEISKIPDTKMSNMKKEELVFYHGRGCPECTNGYHGRIGIYEVLEMNEKIEALAVNKQPASAIAEQACKDGMMTMKQDGILKAIKGITTIDEVLRVTSSD